MRRPLTPDEKRLKGEQMRAAWKDGKFNGRRTGMHPRHWTPEQNRALTALAGTRPIEEIADELERRFYIRRTIPSLRIQAKRLGISLWQGGLSMRDLTALFGFDHRVIRRHWIEPGFLHARRWGGRGPNDGWWVETSEVERFIREHGWFVDLARMPKGHRLTRLAETALKADPWVCGLDAIGRVLGVAPVQVQKWMTRGLFPHERRPVAGPGGLLCVRGRDVTAIAKRRAEIRAANIARFTAMRRGAIRAAS